MKVRVCIQRFVCLLIETRAVPYELLAASARLDQCHAAGPPCAAIDTVSRCWKRERRCQ